MGRPALLLALVLLLLAAAGTAAGSTQAPSFARADYAQLGSNHIAADFNGDGRLDVAGMGAESAAILLNTGTGSFGPRAEFPVAGWAQDVAAGDFDGDGRLDLAVTINDPETSLSLLAGNGKARSSPPARSTSDGA